MEAKSKKAIAANEGLHVNNNHDILTPQQIAAHQQPKLITLKDIMKLKQQNHVGRVGNKNANYKDMAKANQRRHEKVEREKNKLIEQRIKEAQEREAVEWAVTDKDDLKHQKKMAKAMEKDDGPSLKA